MAAIRIRDETLEEVVKLAREKNDPAEIGRRLNLGRMQVLAILARGTTETNRPLNVEPTEGGPDLWMANAVPDDPPSGSLPPYERSSASGGELRRAEEELERPSTGIYLGDEDDYGVPVTWEPANSKRVQNPHLMVMGESGSGKTYALQSLIAELAHGEIPSIVFDYGESFELEKLDRHFAKICKPREYLIGEHGLALNPFRIFPADLKGPATVAARLSDVFDASFRLGDIQKKVFIDAVLQAFERAGILVSDRSTWSGPPPSIASLKDTIDHLASDRSYANYKNAAGLSARLTTFFMLASFDEGPEWSWDGFVEDPESKVHILQFRGLEGKTQRVLVELLLWHMFFHLKSQGQQKLRLFCVLDEAHHLSFRENGPVNSLLREARKFGLGIIFASQQPEDFNPVAYSNSASKLVFQTSDPNLKVSKFLADKSTNFSRAEEVRDIVSKLDQGRALFITQNKGYVTQIADFAKRSTFWRSR